MRNFFSKSFPGFSLLEAALVLLILGIVMGAGASTITGLVNMRSQHLTQSHLEQLMSALSSYVLQHKVLPCPGDPSAQDGKAKDVCDTSYHGIVPFQTLGLDEKIAKDGYYRWISYSVNPGLTGHKKRVLHLMANPKEPDVFEDIEDEEIFCEISDQIFQIKQKGTPIDTAQDPIAAVLVAHGKEGYGAFQKDGSRLTPAGGLDENSNNDNVFDATTKLDQKILWVTRNNLMALYGQLPCSHR